MNEATDKNDYSATLYLPQTEFPMRAGLPQQEPKILARWNEIDLYGKLRAARKGRERLWYSSSPTTPPMMAATSANTQTDFGIS